MVSLRLSIPAQAARAPGVPGDAEPGPTPTPTPGETVSAMLMGQSEMAYLVNPGSFYRQIAQPVPGDGNLILFTQDGNGSPPIRTEVNAETVAAGQVNPAMAALSALLDHAAPGVRFVLGDGAVGGTGRYDLADDSTDAADTRLWGDFASVADAMEAEFGPVGSLIECWYNSDASLINSFAAAFWPLYFGANGDGTPFELGDTINARQIDHCLWDASAAADAKGRGMFARADTAWHLLSPMPFLDAPVDPTPEMANFSANNARMIEPRRANVLALASDPLAEAVNLRIGPSAHLCRFGGASTEIHPDRGSADGQVLLGWPVAIALLRASGMTIGEPTIVGVEGPGDGSHVDLLVDLPNGGDLTTLAALRGTSYSGAAPHQQAVTGVELTRAGGERRPVFRESETAYPPSHRGTVTIVDAGSGSPRRGRVRIVPEQPFQFGDNVAGYLRGQATAALIEPRDLDLYPWFLLEHVPALYDASATYPMEGIAVRPHQADLAIPADAPSFQPRAAYFDGASYYAAASGMNIAAGDRGLISLWLRSDEVAWNEATRRLFQLRVGSSEVLALRSNSAGRLTFALASDGSLNTGISAGFDVNQYFHVLIGWGPGGASVYVNGALNITSSFANVSFAGQTVTQLGVGAQSTGVNPWLGDIGHLYINLAETLDLSVEANRERFIMGGAPVDLGANGQLPTGNVPAIYYDGEAPAWANQGSASNVSMTGLLAGSSILPAL